MPTFKIAGQSAHIWIPTERIVSMETAPGGLTTLVRAMLVSPQGAALGTLEVEGRCDVLGGALDRGTPVEVGQ